jgi:hypothetical protein
MNIGLGLIAAAGLIAALLVHGLTYVSVDAAARFPAVWELHLASILIMVPVIWHLRSTVGSRLRLADIRALLPPWAAGLCIAVMIYTFANFAFGLKNTEGGSVSVKDGHYVLQSHGRLIRTLTASEYTQQKLYVTRMFSGHWVFFFLIPALYFLTQNQSDTAR